MNATFAPRALPPPMALLPALLSAVTLAGCAGTAQRAVPEPAVQRIVSEDDQVRITELRVRGQTQSIAVQHKDGGPAYSITPTAGGSDPSAAKGGAGQRVWTLLSF